MLDQSLIWSYEHRYSSKYAIYFLSILWWKKNNSVSSLSQLISIYFTSIVICTFLVNSSRIRVSNIESFTSLKDGITSPCMCRLKVLAWKCSRMRKIGRHMNAWRGMNLKKNINTGIRHEIGKHSKEILLVVIRLIIK